MGTLTGDCPELEAHCPHKLATSCRLTSTLNCCACADERPHTRTYRVYIDGIGFVQRGTRWQGYCWFCKEFWNNRLAATDPPLEISQTRIPEIPDQTEFLERWFEFHRGYRSVKGSDGTETRIAVLGEPWKEVSPGFIPRTLDEMRMRRVNDATRAANRFRRRRLSSEDPETGQEPHQSLESALDDLLEEASADEVDPSDTQDDDPVVGDHSPPATRGTSIREQRARERFTRLFGTRQDVEQDDYVSPLTSMYQRAYTRYNEAERLRETGDNSAPSLAALPETERRRVEQQILWSVMQDSRGELQRFEESNLSATIATPSATAPSGDSMTATSSPVIPGRPNTELRDVIARLNTTFFGGSGARPSSSFLDALRNANGRSLDMDQQDRPPPLEDEEMTKKLACSICYSQLANTALLPCGHMIMCEWCAELLIPVKHSHVPISPTNCPKCRKQVKQRFKIHL